MLYTLGKTMYVDCPKCHEEISTLDAGNDIRVIGAIVRLRCVNPDCQHLDWYLESEFRGSSQKCCTTPVPPRQQAAEKRL